MKRSVKMLLLLCLLAAVSAGYFLLSSQQEKTASVAETAGSFPVSEKTAEQIVGIEWESSGTAWHFTYSDGTWLNADNSAFPVNQMQLVSLAEHLGSLTAVREITGDAEPENYGLAEPVFTVSVSFDDGSTVRLSQGDATPFADGYYLATSERTDAIYTISDALAPVFQKSLSDLTAKENIPIIGTITRMTVDDTLDIRYEEESRTIDPEQHWYDVSTGEALDENKVESLLSALDKLTWESVDEISASDERLEELLLTGEANRMTVYDEQGEVALTMLFGGTHESGSRYARLADSRMVYTISDSDADALLSASADSLRIEQVVTVSLDIVQEITFVSDGITRTLFLQPGEPENEADSEQNETGETEEAASTLSEEETLLWEKFSALTASGRKPEDAAPGEVLLTVSVSTVSEKRAELTIRSCDADFYILIRPDCPDVLVSAAEVDTILRILRNMG